MKTFYVTLHNYKSEAYIKIKIEAKSLDEVKYAATNELRQWMNKLYNGTDFKIASVFYKIFDDENMEIELFNSKVFYIKLCRNEVTEKQFEDLKRIIRSHVNCMSASQIADLSDWIQECKQSRLEELMENQD